MTVPARLLSSDTLPRAGGAGGRECVYSKARERLDDLIALLLEEFLERGTESGVLVNH